MTYDEFMDKIIRLVRKNGNAVDVRFRFDEEKVRYFADCSDGCTIIAHPSSCKVTIKYRGRKFMAEI